MLAKRGTLWYLERKKNRLKGEIVVFAVRFADELTKVFSIAAEADFLCSVPEVALGRGDASSFQIVVFCDEETEAEVRFPVFCEVWRENFAEVSGGVRVADALFPVKDGRVWMKKGVNALWVRVRTEEDTPVGVLSVPFFVFGEEFVLRVRVYDVCPSRGARCETNTGIGKGEICRKLGLQWEDYVAGDEKTVARTEEAYRRFYEFMVEFGFSPSTLPYPLTDARAEKYLNDARVTSFVLPWNAEEETIGEWARILSEHPAWARKAMFYPVDEPMIRGHLETLKARAERLRSIFPEAVIVTPLHRDLQLDEETDAFRFLEGITDLWCPKAALFSSYIYSEEQRAKYPPVGERMRARKAKGERLWWYVCCEPAHPYANVHMDLPLVEARVLFWQQVKEDVDGFLYWSSTYWQNTEDEFEFAPHYLMGVEKIPVYGDGVLCYMDEDGTPLPSVRLMALSSGMRDYSLLRLLQKKDAAHCKELLERIACRVDDFSRSPAAFSAAREELYRALEN